MKCDRCGYDDKGTGDFAHVCSMTDQSTTERIGELERKNAELKPCPECTNPYLAIRNDIYKDKREFVYCDCCGCIAPKTVWNRIAAQEEQKGLRHFEISLPSVGDPDYGQLRVEEISSAESQAGSAEQVSEPAAFERFMRSRMFIDSDFRKNEFGRYKEHYTQTHWEAWSACANRRICGSVQSPLLEELDWCIEEGHSGPRTHALLVNLRAALSAPERKVTDAELPILPEPAIQSYQTDSVMRTYELRTFSADQMREYALAALNQQGEQTAPKWISVKDRLPEWHKEVIVWREDSGPFLAKRIAYCDVEDSESDSDEIAWLADQYGWQEGSEEPTHWMPLPADPSTAQKDGGRE